MPNRIDELTSCITANTNRQPLTDWVTSHLSAPITLTEINLLNQKIGFILPAHLITLLKETEIDCYVTRLTDQKQNVDDVIPGMISSCFSDEIVMTILKAEAISEARRKNTAEAFIMSFSFDEIEQKQLQQAMDQAIEFRLSLSDQPAPKLLEKCCHYYLIQKNNNALLSFIKKYFSTLTYSALCHSMMNLLKNSTLCVSESFTLAEQLLCLEITPEKTIDKLLLLQCYCKALSENSDQKCPKIIFDFLDKFVQSTELNEDFFEILFYSMNALHKRSEYKERCLALWKKLANTFGATFITPDKLMRLLEQLKTLESSYSKSAYLAELFRKNLVGYLSPALDASRKMEPWHLYLVNQNESGKTPQQDYALQLKLKTASTITLTIFEKKCTPLSQEITLSPENFNDLKLLLPHRKNESGRVKEDSSVPQPISAITQRIKSILLEQVHWNFPHTHDSLTHGLQRLAKKHDGDKATIITEHSLSIQDPDAIRASILSPMNANKVLSDKIWRNNPETFTKTLLSSLDSDAIWQSVTIITPEKDIIPCINIIILLLQALKKSTNISETTLLQTRVIKFINEQLPIILIEKNKPNKSDIQEACNTLCQTIKQCLTHGPSVFSYRAMTEQLKTIRPSSKKTSLWDLAEFCGQLISQEAQTHFQGALMDAIDSHQAEINSDKQSLAKAQRRKTIEIMEKCDSVSKQDLLRLFAIKTSANTHSISQLSRLSVSMLSTNDIPEAPLVGKFWEKNPAQDVLEVLRGYPDGFGSGLNSGLNYFRGPHFSVPTDKLFELFKLATIEEQKHILSALKDFDGSDNGSSHTIAFLNNLFNSENNETIKLFCFKIWSYKNNAATWQKINQEKLFEFLKTTHQSFFDPVNTQALQELHSTLGEHLFWRLVLRLYPEASEKKTTLAYQLWTNTALSSSIFLSEGMLQQDQMNQPGQKKPYELFFSDCIIDLVHIYQEHPSIQLACFLGNWLSTNQINNSGLEYNELLCLISGDLYLDQINFILARNNHCQNYESLSTQTIINTKTTEYLFLKNKYSWDEMTWKQQFWTSINSLINKTTEEYYLKARDTLYCIFNAGGEKAQWAYQALVDNDFLSQLPYDHESIHIKRYAIDMLRLCFAMNPVQIHKKYTDLSNKHLSLTTILDSKEEAPHRDKNLIPTLKQSNWLKKAAEQDPSIDLAASVPDTDWGQLKRHIRKNTQYFPDWVYAVGRSLSNLWAKIISCFPSRFPLFYQPVKTNDDDNNNKLNTSSQPLSSRSTIDISAQLNTLSVNNNTSTPPPPTSNVTIHSVPVLTGENNHILLSAPKNTAANTNLNNQVVTNTNNSWSLIHFRKNKS